ncbi:MAG TPA: CPBP family intramembrane glutamic endopeptidase [Nitrospira sp.]
MTPPEPGPPSTTTQEDERGAALALLPIAATLDYYALPDWIQTQTPILFAPQVVAYLAFALWAAHNGTILSRFGLKVQQLSAGWKIGLLTGLGLGCFNTAVILRFAPYLGYDITFLRHTPHALLPVFVMVPWFIFVIAIFVELNFRGFLLGRLVALEAGLWKFPSVQRLSPLALITSALVFAFDPFMVNTFQHLHWIAVWDGLIWGFIWIRTRNLYATIVAHAIEVIVMYSAIRSALME